MPLPGCHKSDDSRGALFPAVNTRESQCVNNMSDNYL